MLDHGWIFVAAMAAGVINAVVGSGTLVTFPVLLALGFSPVAANVTNNLGLVAGSVTATWSYRSLIQEVWISARRLVPAAVIGAGAGSLAVLVLSPGVFNAVVPALVAVSVILVVTGPRLSKRLYGHEGRRDIATGFTGVIVATSFYGGYFGAAQGVLLLALMGVLTPWNMQTSNGVKNLLAALCNTVAAVIFVLFARDQVNWSVVGVIAVGAALGSGLGSTVGKRLPPAVLRAVIVVVGLAALWKLLT